MSSTGIIDDLRAWFARFFGDPDLEISNFRRHTEGFSWQTFTLTAAWRTPGEAEPSRAGFAVRVEPDDGLLAPYDIREQHRLHDALLKSVIPMPRLVALENDRSAIGQPFYVMERVDGNVPVQWRPDDPTTFPDEAARRRFGDAFVRAQAEIHEVDWRGLGLDWLSDTDDPQVAAERQLERWVGYYEESRRIAIPIFDHAIAWLRHNLRASDELVLCHGDYRIGNVMERDGAVVAVFDWELAHIGDPVEDVAYAGLPLWRGRDPRLSHLLLPEEYFDVYRERTGRTIDPNQFRAWTIFGLLKAGACHLRGARAFEDGRSTDLRLAALGHQVQHVARHLTRALEIA